TRCQGTRSISSSLSCASIVTTSGAGAPISAAILSAVVTYPRGILRRSASRSTLERADIKSALLRFGHPRLESLEHSCRNERRRIASHHSNRTHQIGRDMPNGRRGRDVDSLDLRRHLAVHAGHLHFIVEVGTVAQAANDDRSLMGARRINRETRERYH